MYHKNFDVHTDSGVIKCSTYTLRASTQLNLAKTAKNVELMKDTYSDILKTHAVEGLPKHDAELVLINLIAESEHEDKLELPYVCECGHKHSVKFNPKNIYVDYGDSDLSDFYQFKKFKVEFSWPALWANDDVASMIVNSIKAVYVGHERIEVNDLSEDELNEIYDAITEKDITNIKNILTAPQPVSAFVVKCPECGKTKVETLKGFKSFVELL